jgi:hypothetical protein
MSVFDLFVCLAHHHRLNGWQEFRDDQGREPKGRPELEGCAHIPAEDSAAAHAASNAHLSTEALDQIPDLPALKTARRVKTARAFGAD